MFVSFKKIKDSSLDFLFPPVCLHCKRTIAKQNDWLCENCRNSILYYNTFFCSVCKARLPEFKKICHPDAPFIMAGAMDYKNPAVRSLIHFFKYAGFESLGNLLGAKLANYFKEINDGRFKKENSVIVPMPLDFIKERQRGFNQSLLLAESVSANSGIPMVAHCLKRTPSSKPQSKLKAEERTENIRDRFLLEKAKDIAEKNIILIDDVFTTGATAREAVKMIKRTGTKSVLLLALARA